MLAIAPVRPFKSSGGNAYFFGRDGTTATTLQALRHSINRISIDTATSVAAAAGDWVLALL
jgi:hypothetical protein